jgi:hypothetical protein
VRVFEDNPINVMLSVQVISSQKLSSSLKSGIVGVLASNNRLNGLKYFKTLLSRQVIVSAALETAKKLVLLRRFDIVDDVN